MNNQSNDFKWFKEHNDSLFAQYGNSYIAIKNQTVLGAFSSYAEGVSTISRTEPLGTFIVQHCTGDKTGYTNYIYSMNY